MILCADIELDDDYEVKIPPVGVLMGQIGTGKTTILNQICGTNYPKGSGLHSQTRNLFKNLNSCGGCRFELIDTPGTDSSEETYKHAVLLREVLTASEVNTIFIIVKFDNRYIKMLENFHLVQEAVAGYEKKIVIMVSHWDLSNDPDKDSKEIFKLLSEECSNILLYSEKSNTTAIANAMYGWLSKMPKEKLEIPDEEFFLNFNIYKIKHSMIKDYLSYEKRLKKLEKEFSDLPVSAKIEESDKDEFIHSLIVSFSIESGKLLESFQKKYAKEMTGLDHYASWIRLQKECLQLNDSFVKNMSVLMSYNLNDKQDPRNMIKKCPNCQLIWFKTEGCSGKTSCGNRVSSSYDVLKTSSLKFEFIRKDDGSYEYIKRTLAPVAAEKFQVNPDKKGGAGCGTSFWWAMAPKVEEEKILELFQAKSIDEVKKKLTEKDFVKQVKEYDLQIDKTFYHNPPSNSKKHTE